MNFLDLGLSENTVKAIEEFGVTQPTTVQQDVIPLILEGKDVFAIAPRGCGKTSAYVFPLIDILASRKNGQNILILTSTPELAIVVSDRLTVFNRYHEISDEEKEANVIITTPDLLLEIVDNDKLDLNSINVLVVDDINYIKVNKQLHSFEKIMELLPKEKQSIVFTNRRSKETDSILSKILKTPEEIKVDKAKELEAVKKAAPISKQSYQKAKTPVQLYYKDEQAVALAQKNKSFKEKAPAFIFNKGVLAETETETENE